ncbi:hypothetical protein GB937_001586 [Aspergillus fischeri]|nr:hypothetical protein GB937_001586 [Aspergillus fischeri]
MRLKLRTCIYGVNSGFSLYPLAIDLVAVLVVCKGTLIVMAYGLLAVLTQSALSSIDASSAQFNGNGEYISNARLDPPKIRKIHTRGVIREQECAAPKQERLNEK